MRHIIAEEIKRLEENIKILEGSKHSNQSEHLSLNLISLLYGRLAKFKNFNKDVVGTLYCYQQAARYLIQQRENKNDLEIKEIQLLVFYINQQAWLLETQIKNHTEAISIYCQLLDEIVKQLQNVTLNCEEKNYFVIMYIIACFHLGKIYAESPISKNLELTEQYFTEMLNAQYELTNLSADYWRMLSNFYELAVSIFFSNSNFLKAFLFCKAATDCLKKIEEKYLKNDDYKRLTSELMFCGKIAEEKLINMDSAISIYKEMIHYASEVAENPNQDNFTQNCYWEIVAIINNKIANIFIASNSINDALEFLRRAIDVLKKTEPTDNKDKYHYQMAELQYKFSELCQKIDRLMAAENYCLEAIKHIKEIKKQTQEVCEVSQIYNERLQQLRGMNNNCSVNNLTARGSPILQKRKSNDVLLSQNEGEFRKKMRELHF